LASSSPDTRPRCQHEGCRKLVKKGRRKFCSDTCAQKFHQQRYRESKAAEAEAAENPIQHRALTQGRRGKLFDRIKDTLTDEEWEDWLGGRMLNTTISRQLRVSESAVYRVRIAALAERDVEVRSQVWEVADEFAAMLGPSDAYMRKLWEDGETEAFEAALDQAVAAFKDWRDHFFEFAPGRPFITRDFHLAWIREVLATIYTGGRTMILSPPRHGKSELLVHFCPWLILRNPDIRILWIGPNSDIAENMLGSVRDILADHEQLIEAYLPPNQAFRPLEKGGLWARTKFTVKTRTRHQKQPTMWCTGVSGRIHSLDCDFIVVDDPEDPENVQTPSARQKTKDWFRIKVATRKMFWTGMVIISSRVHFDDLYSLYLESDNWRVRVDKAHDAGVCGREVAADHSMVQRRPDGSFPCVLFPELNPLEYLVEQEDTVGRSLFEMMYLNQPRPEGSMIFDPDIIREKCLDLGRPLGLDLIPDGYRLIAGLDPAARQTQAAFLWAVTDDGTAYMVDLETQKAGGVDGAVRLMDEWYREYGVEVWVIEDVGYQRTFFDHPAVKARKEQGFTIRPTHTGMNKHDPYFGVSAMARQYHSGTLRLPYGDHEARRKTDMLIRELVMFTDDSSKQRKNKSDILMASWFPWSQVIKGWQKQGRQKKATLDYAASYPGLETLTDANSAPWSTAYPTR